MVTMPSIKSFPFVLVVATHSLFAHTCSEVSTVEYTFYGYPDSDPLGSVIGYKCGGLKGVARGSGTYGDPLMMATTPGECSKCEILYAQYL